MDSRAKAPSAQSQTQPQAQAQAQESQSHHGLLHLGQSHSPSPKRLSSNSATISGDRSGDRSGNHSGNHSGDASPSNFFSSVFNAASSFAGIHNGSAAEKRASRNRSVSDASFFEQYDDDAVDDEFDTNTPSHTKALKDIVIEPLHGSQSAIQTLGKGELSLASLGLEPDAEPKPSHPPSSHGPTEDTVSVLSGPESTSERGEDGVGGGAGSGVAAHGGAIGASGTAAGTGAGMGRSKSTASSLVSKRHTSVAPSMALQEATPEDDSPVSSYNSEERITGFAYASKKRNKEFHRLFRSIPTDDYLLDDFSCALSREILIQGRLYVSERHVCFNSNILGWVTNLIIGFDEIVALEKKSTAGLFPNGILIQTLHARHSFASFVSRDSALEFLTSIWKQASPHQSHGANYSRFSRKRSDTKSQDDSSDSGESESAENGREPDAGHSDADSGSSLGSFGSSDNDVDSEIENDEVATEDEGPAPPKAEASRSRSNSKKVGPSSSDSKRSGGGQDAGAGGNGGENSGSGDWPVANLGPGTHAPTSLSIDYESNGEKVLVSETFPVPVGVLANLLFGEDISFMKKFIVDTEKNQNLEGYGPFGSDKTRKYEYIKPLSAPVGPKQTKCVCTDSIDKWDMEDSVMVITSTSTPDVPSGNSFVSKTRYVLTWSEKNGTKLAFSCWMEWSGKSWIKGAIERGNLEGQTTFGKDLSQAINSWIQSAQRKKGGAGEAGPKKKTQKKRAKKAQVAAKDTPAAAPVAKKQWWQAYLPFSVEAIPSWGLAVLLLSLYTVAILRLNSGGATRAGSNQDRANLRALQEEYEVWEWIDNRLASPTGLARPTQLEAARSKQEISESIRLAELRLNKIKQNLT